MCEMPPDRTAVLAICPFSIRPGWDVIDSCWFQQGLSYGIFTPSIGLLLTRTEFGYKCYMGIGLGLDLASDLKVIAEYGTRLDNETSAKFWPDVSGWAES